MLVVKGLRHFVSNGGGVSPIYMTYHQKPGAANSEKHTPAPNRNTRKWREMILSYNCPDFQGVAKIIERMGIMKSILEEFAYGNINPNEQSFKKNSPFGDAMTALSSNEEKLLARLGGDDKVILEKYIDAQGEVNRMTAIKNLIYGYKLGVLMTAEAFLTSEDLIVG